MKISNKKADESVARVHQWIEARAGQPVQIEVSRRCGDDGIVIQGLEVLGIEDGPLLAFAGEDRVSDVAIPVSDRSLAAFADGNSMVLHLKSGGLCVHIWDSNRVGASLRANGLPAIDSSPTS